MYILHAPIAKQIKYFFLLSDSYKFTNASCCAKIAELVLECWPMCSKAPDSTGQDKLDALLDQ